MHKDTDWNLPSDFMDNCDSYDISGGDLGTTFVLDLSAGYIEFLETGLYLVAAGGLMSAFPAAYPNRVEIGISSDTYYPLVHAFANDTTIGFTSVNQYNTVTAFITVTELLGAPDDWFRGNIGQLSGADVTVTRFSLAAYKIRDL
jgi:hypothetical protein